jgi:hypothetical protein
MLVSGKSEIENGQWNRTLPCLAGASKVNFVSRVKYLFSLVTCRGRGLGFGHNHDHDMINT